jgi:hypothetical protein
VEAEAEAAGLALGDADGRALAEAWTDTATGGRVELTFWLLFNQPPS